MGGWVGGWVGVSGLLVGVVVGSRETSKSAAAAIGAAGTPAALHWLQGVGAPKACMLWGLTQLYAPLLLLFCAVLRFVCRRVACSGKHVEPVGTECTGGYKGEN